MENSITKEQLAQLPSKSFTGNVIVANTLEEADAAIAAIREAKTLVGFDTETRPAFVKGVTYRVALVQLSIHNTAYLFRLNKIQCMPASLKGLLEDPDVIKVGLSTQDDFRNLRVWGELNPKGVIELQQYAAGYGIKDKSLTKMHALLFGTKLSKRQRLTNWEAESLTDHQLAYAALDAVACVDIYNELSRRGRQIISKGER